MAPRLTDPWTADATAPADSAAGGAGRWAARFFGVGSDTVGLAAASAAGARPHATTTSRASAGQGRDRSGPTCDVTARYRRPGASPQPLAADHRCNPARRGNAGMCPDATVNVSGTARTVTFAWISGKGYVAARQAP